MVDCLRVDLFLASQILYQTSFELSPPCCLKLSTSFSGVEATSKELAIVSSKDSTQGIFGIFREVGEHEKEKENKKENGK